MKQNEFYFCTINDYKQIVINRPYKGYEPHINGDINVSDYLSQIQEHSLDFSKYEEVFISKSVSLDESVFDIIKVINPKKVVVHLIEGESDFSYDEQETITLAKNVNKLYGNNIDVEFTSDNLRYDLNEILKANRQINSVVDLINKATDKEGNPLSEIEKFIYAYAYVRKRFKYKEAQEGSKMQSRELISVLNGDKVVCVGYVMTLCEILRRLGVFSAYVSTRLGKALGNHRAVNKTRNHAELLVGIRDEKYNIEGIYISDPTNEGIENALITNYKIKKHPDKYIAHLYDFNKHFIEERRSDAEDFISRLNAVNSIKELDPQDKRRFQAFLTKEIKSGLKSIEYHIKRAKGYLEFIDGDDHEYDNEDAYLELKVLENPFQLPSYSDDLAIALYHKYQGKKSMQEIKKEIIKLYLKGMKDFNKCKTNMTEDLYLREVFDDEKFFDTKSIDLKPIIESMDKDVLIKISKIATLDRVLINEGLYDYYFNETSTNGNSLLDV